MIDKDGFRRICLRILRDFELAKTKTPFDHCKLNYQIYRNCRLTKSNENLYNINLNVTYWFIKRNFTLKCAVIPHYKDNIINCCFRNTGKFFNKMNNN